MKESEAAPHLATADQQRAEQVLLALLDDAELQRLQADLRAELAATERGGLRGASARVDRVVAQWTNSFILGEYSAKAAGSPIVWLADDAARSWMGRTVGGSGMSADNPDAIYRTCTVDGGALYEITGRLDAARRPAQLVIEVAPNSIAEPWEAAKTGWAPLALLTDRDLRIDAEGRFRLTIGPGEAAPGHIPVPAAPLALLFRDMLANWSQQACELSVRRLDGAGAAPFDEAAFRAGVLARLPTYVRFWAGFPDLLPFSANALAGPAGREGGWGYIAQLRFEIEPNQAIVIRTVDGGAAYTGALLTDSWNMALDARGSQASLNLGQALRGADGSLTYVIAPEDPRLANWLDTGGLLQGFAFLRWQALPPGADPAALVQDFRIVNRAELGGLADVPRATTAERAAALARRATDYARRWT